MTVIDDLLKDLPEPYRDCLQHIRELILQTVPDAEEVMTYGMPGFKYRSKYLISFAAFKDHLSVFPGAETIETLKDQLGAFKTSKGTIQFTLDNQLSDDLVVAIVTQRVHEIESTART